MLILKKMILNRVSKTLVTLGQVLTSYHTCAIYSSEESQEKVYKFFLKSIEWEN